MRAAFPILLAGLGGAALAVAVRELLGSLPRAGEYVTSAVTALGRAGREGSAPSEIERRRLGVVAGAALGLSAWLLLGSAPGALIAGLGPAAAGWAIDRRRRRYRTQVEDQIPALANGLADALAAGGSLRTGLRDLLASIEGPASIELRRVDADLSVGVPPRQALGALADRVGSEPVSALVRAVLSQQRSGGDLARLLRAHGEAAVQRQRAEAEARSATAQARLTGGMVAAMPLGAALLVEMVAPGFLGSMLAEPVAVVLLVLALLLQACGYLLIQRLGRVRA
jgi:tight adherence protein B